MLRLPIMGGLFGSGRFELVTKPVIYKGLHGVRFMVIEPSAGRVLSIANTKADALSQARKQIADELGSIEPQWQQGILWPSSELPTREAPNPTRLLGLLHRDAFRGAMSEDSDDPWGPSLEAAHEAVKRARSGDLHAARDVLSNAVIAIRSLMQFEEADPNRLRLDVTNLEDQRRLVFNEPPDPHRLVYLRGLLLSLIEIENGTPPIEALHLVPPPRRPDNPAIPARNVLLFVMVGQALDRLVEKGWTRMDRPIAEAIAEVATQTGASPETVQKAWSTYGSAKGWEERKSDWK